MTAIQERPAALRDFGTAPPLSGFLEINGPLYVNYTPPEITLAYHVRREHCGLDGNCDAGLALGFIDLALGVIANVKVAPTKIIATISLAATAFRPIPVDAVALATGTVAAVEDGYVSIAGHLSDTDGKPFLIAQAVYWLPERETPGYDIHAVLLEGQRNR